LISAIMSSDPPPVASLQPLVPPTLDRVVKKCLAKDPQARWHSAHDLHDELVWVAGDAASAAPVSRAPRSSLAWRIVTHALSVLVASAVVGTAVWLIARASMPAPRVSRFTITPRSAAALTINGTDRDLAITPDGTRVVYVGANGSALFVRALDQLDATRLTGLGAPHGPFLSPDGQWIGFADGPTTLKKVALSGGPAVLLGRLNGNSRGATWGPDDTIVFATSNVTTGLQQIPAAGGEPTVLTRPNRAGGEADHLWPEFLPDGEAVLFTITRSMRSWPAMERWSTCRGAARRPNGRWCGSTDRGEKSRSPRRRERMCIHGLRPTAPVSRSASSTRRTTSGCGTSPVQRSRG
jgi:serine/threonine-protein kinase